MIEEILPAVAAVAEARGDWTGGDLLFAEERALAVRATPGRRAEIAAGRACAHRALRTLDLPTAPVLRGERGEPLWPAGVVGSITHCDGYRACAVARASELLALAIDAEPHAPLSARLLERIATPAERHRIAELAAARPAIRWDKLLFSAKECVYKALSPTASGAPRFADTELQIDPDRGNFAARLPAGCTTLAGKAIERLEGRWLVRDGLVLTAVAAGTGG